jgi:cation diffusion facilitator family transporter
MSAPQPVVTPTLPATEKQAVAVSSVTAAAFLTAMTAVVGLLTGSLGILSEAAHSVLDFVAAGLTLVSVRLADRPADTTHPFGHEKFEHLSALAQAALLVVTYAWVIFEGIRRLFFREVHVDPSVWAFGVMLVSMVVDAFRSRALFRVARKYNSQALEADALHFSTHLYSASVVILGLLLVYVSRQRNIPWLRHGDAMAGLAVAGISVYVSLGLGRRTIDALVDAAPEGITRRISEVIAPIPGVLNLDRIRVRQSGSRLFVDMKLTLESNIPLEHAKSVADLVEAEVHRLYSTADVVIHTTPREPSADDVVEKIRSIAHRQNFLIHEVTAYEVDRRVIANLDVEVDPDLRLDVAHDQATRLETAILQELPAVREVNIHIEPLLRGVEPGNQAPRDRAQIERRLMKIARATPGVLDCHSVEAHQVGEKVVVRMHCTVEPQLPVERVHDLTEILEFKFRQAFPQIFKVSIHAEPRQPRDKQSSKPEG